MSFMERVSTFFGLEDEEYAGNEQREQTQKVAAKTVQQNRTAKKSAPSQKKVQPHKLPMRGRLFVNQCMKRLNQKNSRYKTHV
ncbi:hypothetical protein GCM10025854_18670 [Tetragenococcus muriaticus]|nr:hypothetical protein GCM10025854_18670 [Tetragenococcus muriaticus]